MLCYLVLYREVCFDFTYPEYTIMHCHIDISKMASLSVKRSINGHLINANFRIFPLIKCRVNKVE